LSLPPSRLMNIAVKYVRKALFNKLKLDGVELPSRNNAKNTISDHRKESKMTIFMEVFYGVFPKCIKIPPRKGTSEAAGIIKII
jgi:hypothetical protein